MKIAAGALAAMIAHAREHAPDECCGLLIERGGVIDEAVRARNLRGSPTAYLVDPRDHFAAIKRARMEGARLAGAYHSHPRSAPVPSETDLAEAHDPELLYVIVSLAGREPEVKGWRLVEGAAHPVELEFR